MREFVSPANAMTSGNLVCGLLAIILSGQGEYGWAAGVVGMGATLDAADGMTARRFPVDDEGFGSNLDSLADLATFGIAPALMLYQSMLHEIDIIGIAACLGFVLCGAWRLARFPLVETARHFVGLPIPVAGVTAVALAAWQPPSEFALTITLAVMVLMISVLPFPTLFPKRRARHAAEAELKEAGAPSK